MSNNTTFTSMSLRTSSQELYSTRTIEDSLKDLEGFVHGNHYLGEAINETHENIQEIFNAGSPLSNSYTKEEKLLLADEKSSTTSVPFFGHENMLKDAPNKNINALSNLSINKTEFNYQQSIPRSMQSTLDLAEQKIDMLKKYENSLLQTSNISNNYFNDYKYKSYNYDKHSCNNNYQNYNNYQNFNKYQNCQDYKNLVNSSNPYNSCAVKYNNIYYNNNYCDKNRCKISVNEENHTPQVKILYPKKPVKSCAIIPSWINIPNNSKFFIIKSNNLEHIKKSFYNGIWSSTHFGNKRLSESYKSLGKENGEKIFLFYSVNGSGKFCGVAEMISDLRNDLDTSIWDDENSKYGSAFKVRWTIVRDINNKYLKKYLLPNNEMKPMTNSRDTQEIPFIIGCSILKLFKSQSLDIEVISFLDIDY